MGSDIAPRILRRFGLEPRTVRLIKESADDRAVWRIDAAGGTYALKRFHKPERARTAALVTQYLQAREVPVAPVVPATDGIPYVVHDGRYYALFGWIDGERPSYAAPGMIEAMSALLARFHLASAGYPARDRDIGCRINWQKHYVRLLARLDESEALARAAGDDFAKVFLPEVPWLRERANWTRQNLRQARFGEPARQARRRGLLGHLDYSRDNLLITPAGDLIIIDLDTAAISLPVWDLSRLITWINHDRQNWSTERMERVLAAYGKVRPLSPAERDLLLVDQAFPHQALSLARERYGNSPSPTLLQELTYCLETDRVKLTALGIGPS